VCDFQREKAWGEWLSKSSNGVKEYKDEILGYLRVIAKSMSQTNLEENINVLCNSRPWDKSPQLQKYFS
jgi:hypothetical protein